MQKHWVTAVMMVMLALVIAAPASAQVVCKAQAVLSVDGKPCAVGAACGQAEKKFQNAVKANPLLKINGLNAANQFDANIQGLKPTNAYTLTASDSGGHAVGSPVVFGTDGSGHADVDVKGLAGQSACSINNVKVRQFGDTTGKVILQGTFGAQNEVQAENEMQVENQVEAELELNNVIENEVQAELQAQPNNAAPNP